MDKFSNDLKSGNSYEDLIISILEESGYTFIKKSNPKDLIERKEYDFIMNKDGKDFKFEVKSDCFMYETKNEITEYNCNGKWSGVKSSKSDFFITVYYMCDLITIYDTNELRNFCDVVALGSTEQFIEARYSTKGGDKGLAKNILCLPKYMKEYIKSRQQIRVKMKPKDPYSLLNHLYFSGKSKNYPKLIEKLNQIINEQ